MLESILHEYKYIQLIHKEYFNNIIRYQNINRQSIFIKYYNIDVPNSTYEDVVESTYDIYTSDIRFKLYEMTPVFFIQPVLNRSNTVTDFKGQFFDGSTTINIYTIDSPKINDIISFYPPVTSNEIFRVRNISTPINAYHSLPSLRLFELELEYAPTNINNLKISDKFIYDLSVEKYLQYTEYVSKLSALNDISIILDKLLKFYNNKFDLYENNHIIPIITNELIMHFKKEYSINYNRMFEKYPYPYGYFYFIKNIFFNSIDDILNLNSIEPVINSYICYDLDKNEYFTYIPNDDKINDIIELTKNMITVIKKGI